MKQLIILFLIFVAFTKEQQLIDLFNEFDDDKLEYLSDLLGLKFFLIY